MKIKSLFAVAALLIASIWVALVNGQPLFHPDTPAYVRGPDFAIVYFFGNKFATTWTQKRILAGDQSLTDQGDVAPGPVIGLNSPFEKFVLAGRSIYYGALLYASHLTGSLWPAALAQGAVFIYLSFVLIVTCLGFSLLTLVCIDVAVLVATPVSFVISSMMPDIFAAFVILSAIIIAAFWDRLTWPHRAGVSAIMIFSAITHNSHLLLLGGLVLLIALLWSGEKASRPRIATKTAGFVLGALFLCGVFGELAFTYATKFAIGEPPVRPPFVMARLIADGPGYRFLKENCPQKPYIACNYLQRLPMPEATFLWSTEPREGVFGISDLATRRAMAKEQTSFILDVLRFEPMTTLLDLPKNTVFQLFNIDIDQFFLQIDHYRIFKARLPGSYFDTLLQTRIVSNDGLRHLVHWPAKIFYTSIYVLSILGLLALLFWPALRKLPTPKGFSENRWVRAASVAICGIFFNAAICGILSGPIPRYQTRVSWVPLLLALVTAAGIWKAMFPQKKGSAWMRQAIALFPRPLRFLGIGAIGLLSDLASFTLIAALGPHPLVARLLSLAIATWVTWRLNRALTFDRSGRRQHEEALRYAAVTVVAQGTSYAIFAWLILTVLAPLPQVAILIGAAIGALLSYNGHRLLSFAPKDRPLMFASGRKKVFN